jgi:hypothetical protein
MKKLTLLGPRNIEDGYLIESGFVTLIKILIFQIQNTFGQ